ncbi:Putative proline/betaine transporter [Seminavis robusta]|uniref:Proline/betaine transporter n=1 Tax=Seminavis robusta TaxID=568900 RepID=A0A9N8DPF2_9STRA|nr:Putative proline/betaine transporter [Seminavis robusta]|eukprot:Sro245_g097410.1 Putative proline/betaine transporter (584) ;mRNA; f:44501-46436
MMEMQQTNTTQAEAEGASTPQEGSQDSGPIEGITALQDSDYNLPEAERQMKEEELSFYSASENEHGDDNIWGLLSGVGGNIFEWYDFAVYGLLAPEIGQCFFPKSSRELQLINSFGVYLAAFIMRPLGAILFGEMGDRMVGRKDALAFSIILITVPSVLLGLLPTYETWGPVAPVCLVILRMMQGLSVGGQLAGSYVLSIEQSSPKTRGFRGSVCDASSVGGFLLASAVTTLTRTILSKEAVNTWGWRVPFWVSLLLAPLLYYIVGNTEESKFWAERAEQKETEQLIRESEHADRPAVVDLVSSPFRRRQLTGMVGVLSAVASSFYILFLWTPVYLSELRGVMKENEADALNFLVVGSYIILLMIAGRLSDMFPHRMDLVRIGLPGVIVGCPVMFGLFETESYVGYFLGQLQFAVCLSFVQGCMAAWEVELWMADPTLSFTGVAVGHNLAATIFGGTMPLVATFLYYRSSTYIENGDYEEDDPLFPRLIPGLYISLLGCISFYCISNVIRHPHDVRTGSPKLREAIRKQNEFFKKAKKDREKLKRRRQLEGILAENGLDVPVSTATSSPSGAAEAPVYVPPVV